MDPAAEQNFDSRKRQCDGDDHHHHAARRDHRLRFDDGRRRDLNGIDPARKNGELWWLDIYPAIDPWCLHRFCIKQHLRYRFMPLGLIDFLLNFMNLDFLLNFMDLMVPTCRCRVPAMILAMPIDVHRTKMLTP